jgi:hypothetical protein
MGRILLRSTVNCRISIRPYRTSSSSPGLHRMRVCCGPAHERGPNPGFQVQCCMLRRFSHITSSPVMHSTKHFHHSREVIQHFSLTSDCRYGGYCWPAAPAAARMQVLSHPPPLLWIHLCRTDTLRRPYFGRIERCISALDYTRLLAPSLRSTAAGRHVDGGRISSRYKN